MWKDYMKEIENVWFVYDNWDPDNEWSVTITW